MTTQAHTGATAQTVPTALRAAIASHMRAYLFLPLAHALARVTQLVVLTVGGELVFWRGDPKRIVGELAEARPTHFPSVPRVFEKIHTAILGGVEEQGTVKRLARIEQIKRFAILDHDLSQAAGKLTPTLKIKRAVVAERYHDLVEELYA